MIELTRFQLLRPAQTIADEDKIQVGLPLYGKQPLSHLAQQLALHTTLDETQSIVARFIARNNGAMLLSKTPPDPDLLSLYQWLSKRVPSVTAAQLADFVQSWSPQGTLALSEEWPRIADNLLVSLIAKEPDLSVQYDLQLLIRTLYIYSLGLRTRGQGGSAVTATATDGLLNQIMSTQILLPKSVLLECCSNTGQSRSVKVENPAPIAALPGRRLPCECLCDEECHLPNNFCLCIRPYVADLFIIKESLARYEAGELADIQNILAGEMKVRHHRLLTRSEQTDETDTETSTSEERDHQVDEKSSLQNEVKKTVDNKTNVDAGVTATFKYGNSITVTPHANVTANFAKSQASSQAQSYAKDVVDRSVSTLQTKTRTVSISKLTTETEEENKDSIDNSAAGSDHRAGLFYWVNKVTHAQVYNYGRHMMFDMIVPEPAALYKALYSAKMTTNKELQAPAQPNLDVSTITAANYGTLLNQYSIATTDDISPPNDQVTVSIPIAQNVSQADGKAMAFSSSDAKVSIPDGYCAAQADYDLRCFAGDPGSTSPKDQAAVSVHLGKYCLLSKSMDEWRDGKQGMQVWQADLSSVTLNGETGDLVASIAGFSSVALSLSGSISVTCKLTKNGLADWQSKIFQLVMTDYARKLAAYQAALGSASTDIVQIQGRNPFLNREIERNEFKRQIIAILLRSYFAGIGSMVDHVTPCGYPETNFEQLSHDMPIIQFFEQVFEWDYMTYLFYHSMWARRCKWSDLIDENSGDPLFDKFLMSGAARVQVPIQAGMESVFLWFVKHKEIWGESGEPPLPGDDDYVSMIQEMKEADNGDYSDRPGVVAVQQGSSTLQLSGSSLYWDNVHDQLATLTIANDIDRELLVNFKVYRIVAIQDAGANDHTSWTITIDPPYKDANAQNLKFAVGAVLVGAPWEIVVPTELVYLRNKTDLLPVYPLN